MRVKKRIFLIIMALFTCQLTFGQDLDALGTFTPYSLYGIGDLHGSDNAITKGMGGIGMGVRDARYINYKNIASITERDTLSFMLDMGVFSKNMYLKDKNTKSAFNTVNINNFVISMPIKDKHSFVVGIMPYANMGYKFQTTETDPTLISKYGDIKYRKYGNGNINQIFLGGAVKLSKHLSAGVQGIYYFGSQTSHSDIYFNSPGIRSIETGWKYAPHGFGIELAAQSAFKIAEETDITIGATYRMKSKLKGTTTRYAYVTDDVVADTVMNNKLKTSLSIPATLTVGAAIRKGTKWLFGVDYQRQDWSGTDFRPVSGVAYKSQAAQSIKVGMEFVPNRYDIRYYYKRITYRAGFHYDKTYVNVEGKSINQMGVTLGMSLPVNRLNNSFNIAVDIGQRGSKTGNLVKENYVNLIVSLSLHDLWFIKPRYQ